MSYGYSARVIQQNEDADQDLLGVQLGALCVLHDVPVSQVAEKLGVSRQTTYNWFMGANSPRGDAEKAVLRLIGIYSRKK